ncbi:MAG TPA: ATP synthase F0 subunit B, partial [Labilithrix sp.]
MKRFFAIAACVAALGLTALATAQEHGETPHDTAPGHAEPPPDEGHHKKKDLNVADIFDKERPALVALLINFGLLVGLYYTLGRKPIAEALKQRKTTIGKDIEEAQKMLDEALERAKKYQGDLKNVDTDAA